MGSMRRPTWRTSATPSSSESPRSCWDTADDVKCNALAAALTERWWATSWSVLNLGSIM
ncbi:hypothetical protein GCM10023203_39830 [Actinomycetospora straminea]|uniref:Uncharacterized protein n=1 Tax=Actinomycetospora straminea TaxID=663607 RepID=A0ABP9ER12_9PSEU